MTPKALCPLALAMCALVAAPSAWAQEKLPPEADQLVKDFDRRSTDLLREERIKLITSLKPLLEEYTKAGKFGPASAIYKEIEKQRKEAYKPTPAPKQFAVLAYEKEIGRSLFYEVTGLKMGRVVGTDIYGSGSDLGAAAVHAGVLKPDEKGIVRVTFVSTVDKKFTGSAKNGITSESFDQPWKLGYRVEAVP